MGDKTSIEWTEATWNPIAGCSVVSPGCTNCYAMKMAARIERMQAALGKPTHYAGLTQRTKAGPVWNGKLAVAPRETLTQPMRWKRPRRIFVNSMSDLFHEGVADETIDQVFAVMALAPQHTYQVLTKRSARMRAYMTAPDVARRVWDAAYELASESERLHLHALPRSWPLPNVWLGASVEDPPRADERIPDLLATPAAVRFISAEPLLGPVDLDASVRRAVLAVSVTSPVATASIDWVIAGGESGPGARPMHPDWARGLRDQCAAAGVPFFFKQWGNWREAREGDSFDTSRGRANKPPAFIVDPAEGTVHCYLPPNANPRCRTMLEVGKAAAGAELDGKLHREFPT